MTEPGAGFLAAAPLRAKVGERRRARVSLAVLAALLLLCLFGAVPPDAAAGGLVDPTPLLLDGARHGMGYYQAVADAYRFPEAGRPSVWAVPLPAAVLLRGALSESVGMALLWTLAVAAFATWYLRLAAPRLLNKVAVAALLAAALAPFLLPHAADRPESWAALVAAVALGLRPERAWLEAAALGLAAAVLDVAALPLVLGVFVAALWQSERPDAIARGVALILALAVFSFHLIAVLRFVPDAAILPAADPVLGFGPVVAALRETSVLGLLPHWMAATLIAASIWAWGAAGDLRLSGALVWLALATMAVTLPAGPILAVPMLAGLAFVPGLLLRTVRIAIARERRITVRRVVR